MTHAVQSYAELSKAGMSPRDLDASALLRAAGTLQAAISDGGDAMRDAALTHNRRLWTVFAGAAGDENSQLPEPLRANILMIANFVFNTTLTARSAEALGRLVAINRELAAGLRGQ